ncbi:hypothetical protein MSAN_00136500 [Mycena sanguinolenta]|uniref:GATA-type domain-containing protein n=1 Tax=Mycena sanguinolenta TaxID=230812 RepID=A0A8H7DKW1_9AGAR|nr:hypothetical protein MSAN_00136500 [Mycena sanguinolenta]
MSHSLSASASQTTEPAYSRSFTGDPTATGSTLATTTIASAVTHIPSSDPQSPHAVMEDSRNQPPTLIPHLAKRMRRRTRPDSECSPPQSEDSGMGDAEEPDKLWLRPLGALQPFDTRNPSEDSDADPGWDVARECANCRTTTTPMWRRGPD